MAFATSNLVVRCPGSTRVLTGNWTCAAGDAPGTIAIGSGAILSSEFDPRLSLGPSEKPMISTSTTGGVTTVTVYHHATVTAGTFKIEY